MRTRLIVGALALVAMFSVRAVATVSDYVGLDKQWTIVNLVNPVSVHGEYLMGPYLIVHDSRKMARGEACTTFYRFDPKSGPKEAVVSFHCRPVQREACARTTLSVVREASGAQRLIEYQIGGDTEAHGVPTH